LPHFTPAIPALAQCNALRFRAEAENLLSFLKVVHFSNHEPMNILHNLTRFHMKNISTKTIPVCFRSPRNPPDAANQNWGKAAFMQGINKIACELDDGSTPPEIRRAIADLMLAQLQSLRTAPRSWEKVHFANAIAALGMNIHAIQQPTHAWLRLCIVDLKKAIDSTKVHAPYTEQEGNLDAVTIEELIATIESLNSQC
jgi:hypothetical protein